MGERVTGAGPERTPVISLGAGVQSSTLLLMAYEGEYEVIPRLAVFADTGWEPRDVYDHALYLHEQVGDRIEIVHVGEANIREDALGMRDPSRRFASMPLFTRSREREGAESQLRRQCTKEYKIYPIRHELRRRDLNAVELWMGISLDEVQRMKPADVKWVKHRWPLIEKRMTRADCERWLVDHGYAKPPKSACIGCPFHGDRQWREMRDTRPDEWEDAVEFDRAIRKLARIDSPVFLHRQLVPLDEVDLTTAEDHGQLNWDAECEGMCGV